jgi:hypothetical protein
MRLMDCSAISRQKSEIVDSSGSCVTMKDKERSYPWQMHAVSRTDSTCAFPGTHLDEGRIDVWAFLRRIGGENDSVHVVCQGINGRESGFADGDGATHRE